ncbi:hypothetical protein DF134_33905 [Burkholderia stagnalis]|nr:hypothetical protein DF138_33225 [Burkholderia stagnalis]RQQ79878.1 hypothetical protein DF134_33905 [Burkholderia stagnalis]
MADERDARSYRAAPRRAGVSAGGRGARQVRRYAPKPGLASVRLTGFSEIKSSYPMGSDLPTMQ